MKRKNRLGYICDCLADQISSEDKTNEEKEVCAYGIMAFLSFLYNLVPLLVIGVITGQLWAAGAIYLSFSILRKDAGGYHCETPLSCFITTQFMYITFLLLSILLSNFSSLLIIISLWLGIGMGASIVPKPSKICPSRGLASDMEFKKKYLISLFMLFTLSLIFDGLGLNTIASSISMGIISLRILLSEQAENVLHRIWRGEK